MGYEKQTNDKVLVGAIMAERGILDSSMSKRFLRALGVILCLQSFGEITCMASTL